MPATPAADDRHDDWLRGPREFDPAQRTDRAVGGPPLVDEPTEQVPVIRRDTGDDPRPGSPDEPGSGSPGVPARRSVDLPVAGVAALLTVVLAAGAAAPAGAYAVLVFAVQALFVYSWATATRPPAPRTVAGVGLAAAAAADLAAAWVEPASLAPLAYVTAAAFGAGVIGQLARPAGRERVTESLGNTLAVVVGVVALAGLVVLIRQPVGNRSIVACLVAAGAAVTVARLTDTVAPWPRFTPQVPRGGLGVLLGVLVGAVAAAVAGSLVTGVTVGTAAVAGLVAAVIAAVTDLAACYAEAGRQVTGDAPAPGLVARAQGPLLALALSAPVAYVVSALLL
ncbi:hypothetical protein ACNTMW_26685 [Planosporangium sp. 12N6]|uniref:hypothetical protein n=1 Tax=Planosporangium spinosum TaxID=3402278 RepID=UPI003CED3C16